MHEEGDQDEDIGVLRNIGVLPAGGDRGDGPPTVLSDIRQTRDVRILGPVPDSGVGSFAGSLGQRVARRRAGATVPLLRMGRGYPESHQGPFAHLQQERYRQPKTHLQPESQPLPQTHPEPDATEPGTTPMPDATEPGTTSTPGAAEP
ncbi:MAG: hypothetical protein V5A24_09690, partial [Haloarculaceae archaeon]